MKKATSKLNRNFIKLGLSLGLFKSKKSNNTQKYQQIVFI